MLNDGLFHLLASGKRRLSNKVGLVTKDVSSVGRAVAEQTDNARGPHKNWEAFSVCDSVNECVCQSVSRVGRVTRKGSSAPRPVQSCLRFGDVIRKARLPPKWTDHPLPCTASPQTKAPPPPSKSCEELQPKRLHIQSFRRASALQTKSKNRCVYL